MSVPPSIASPYAGTSTVPPPPILPPGTQHGGMAPPSTHAMSAPPGHIGAEVLEWRALGACVVQEGPKQSLRGGLLLGGQGPPGAGRVWSAIGRVVPDHPRGMMGLVTTNDFEVFKCNYPNPEGRLAPVDITRNQHLQQEFQHQFVPEQRIQILACPESIHPDRVRWVNNTVPQQQAVMVPLVQADTNGQPWYIGREGDHGPIFPVSAAQFHRSSGVYCLAVIHREPGPPPAMHPVAIVGNINSLINTGVVDIARTTEQCRVNPTLETEEVCLKLTDHTAAVGQNLFGYFLWRAQDHLKDRVQRITLAHRQVNVIPAFTAYVDSVSHRWLPFSLDLQRQELPFTPSDIQQPRQDTFEQAAHLIAFKFPVPLNAEPSDTTQRGNLDGRLVFHVLEARVERVPMMGMISVKSEKLARVALTVTALNPQLPRQVISIPEVLTRGQLHYDAVFHDHEAVKSRSHRLALIRQLDALEARQKAERAEKAAMVVEEVYENQRWVPVRGWGKVIFSDLRGTWSTAEGNRLKNKDKIALPEGGWVWTEDWRLDGQGSEDPDKWWFNGALWTGQWTPSCGQTQSLRRRLWKRTRVNRSKQAEWEAWQANARQEREQLSAQVREIDGEARTDSERRWMEHVTTNQRVEDGMLRKLFEAAPGAGVHLQRIAPQIPGASRMFPDAFWDGSVQLRHETTHLFLGLNNTNHAVLVEHEHAFTFKLFNVNPGRISLSGERQGTERKTLSARRDNSVESVDMEAAREWEIWEISVTSLCDPNGAQLPWPPQQGGPQPCARVSLRSFHKFFLGADKKTVHAKSDLAGPQEVWYIVPQYLRQQCGIGQSSRPLPPPPHQQNAGAPTQPQMYPNASAPPTQQQPYAQHQNPAQNQTNPQYTQAAFPQQPPPSTSGAAAAAGGIDNRDHHLNAFPPVVAQPASAAPPPPTTQAQNAAAALDDRMDCVVCFSSQKNTMFEPCAHIACCEDCAKLLKECCVCRTPIEKVRKVFM